MHQLITGSATSIQAVCYARRLWCPLPCHNFTSGYDWTDICQPWGEGERRVFNYCDVLLSQQMLPAIKRVPERCLFTKQYVAYGEIGHYLCSVISQGKVVALDRWGGKWNHLSMTHRLATNYAKNYCNRTPIVKVIVENVVTCFWGTQCRYVQSYWWLIGSIACALDWYTAAIFSPNRVTTQQF